MSKIIVQIDNENGLAVPENRIPYAVDLLVFDLWSKGECESIGQHELVNGIRMAVKAGTISDVSFLFENEVIPVMPDGTAMHYPIGFPGDVLDVQLTHLLA